MRVFIIGGTGLLGYHATLALLQKEHHVSALASGGFKPGAWYPDEVELTYYNIFEADASDLTKLLQDYDALVYAVGPDDRVAPPAPAYDFFYERLVETTERVCMAAEAAGVKRVVILNSYLAYFHREHPEWKLAEHHPYIHCRVQQAERTLALANDAFTVMIFEIPYIFGIMPDRRPFWDEVLVSRLNWMKPWIFYTAGGTVMASATYMGQAIYGALAHGQSGRYPIGEQNMSWKEWLTLVSVALYGKEKRIVTLPTELAQLYGKYEQFTLARQNREAGLDYSRYMKDVQSRYTFFSDEMMDSVAAELRIERGSLDEAIYETFSVL